MSSSRSSLLAVLLLVACGGTVPSAPPRDTGPRIDAATDPDAATLPEDASVDAGFDAPVDTGPAPVDVGVDAIDPCAGRADCDMTGGSCETVLGTTTNCMECGDLCRARANQTAMCRPTDGCVATCNLDYADCDMLDGNGCEVNTAMDINHCGDCDTTCETHGSFVSVSCVGGDCVPACQSGHGDCNDDLLEPDSDGCEQGLTTIMNCGRCGSVCTAVPGTHSIPQCVAPTCSITCEPGYRDCNLSVADGCETFGTLCPA